MPLYEYGCKKCGERTEVLQKAKDKPPEKCPKCGGAVVKLISSPAIQFKGNGWYVTDYAKKSPSPAGPKQETRAQGKAEAKTGSDEGAKDKSGTSSS